jgi:hypothetical protein
MSATRLLAAAERAVRDELRGPDGRAPFGPRAEAPAEARPADALAAFLGRSV